MTTSEAADAAKKYEIMLMLSGDLAEDVADKALEHIKTQIAEKGGNVFHEDKWGRRDLAYNIKRQSSAHFVVLNITLDAEHVREIDRSLHLDSHVLRHLLQQVPSGYQVQKFPEKVEEELTEEIMNKPQKKERKTPQPVPTEEPAAERGPQVATTESDTVSDIESVPESKDTGETEEEKSRKKLDEVEEKLRDIISDKDLNL